MATEILVNDGGAPARILPFTAGEDLTAGWPVMVEAVTGDIIGAAGNWALTGFAFTDAADQGMCNVISGSGIMIKAMCVTGTVIGDYMTTGENKLMRTANANTAGAGATNSDYVAIALEANASGSDALTLVLVV